MAQTVLIVDDDAAILEVVRIVLEAENYVVVDDNGSCVDAKVDRYAPDVVLLDIWMTGEDGREIARRLKLYQPTLPIILMSAHSNASSAVQETGADAFLEKPFELDDLVRLIGFYAQPAPREPSVT